MAYTTVPIPNGWTWQDLTTGAPWHTVGDQLELTSWVGAWPVELKWDEESWDWSVWALGDTTDRVTVEYRAATTPPGGAWSTWDGRVLSVACRTGPGLWYQGPRAGSASVRLEQTDTAASRPAIGDELRIMVKLLSGVTKPLWQGRVQNPQDSYTQGLSTLVITVTDVIGWGFQAGTDSTLAVADLPQTPSGNLIYLLFQAAWFADMDPAYLTGVNRTIGFESFGYDTTLDVAVSTAVGELVRADLGLLYSDQVGVLQWKPHNWWVGAGFQAAIGSTRLAPPSPTAWAFPASQLATSESLLDVINQVIWTRRDDLDAVVGTTTQPPTAGSLDQFGRRQLKNSTKLFVGADMVNAAFALKFALENGGKRLTQVSFPANTDLDAQEFAAAVVPGTGVYVLEETVSRAEAWVPAWVMSVDHRIDPNGGWDVTLSLETRIGNLPEITSVPET